MWQVNLQQEQMQCSLDQFCKQLRAGRKARNNNNNKDQYELKTALFLALYLYLSYIYFTLDTRCAR